MRKLFWVFLALVIAGFTACAGSPSFSGVTGREWKLVEVRAQAANIAFDRSVLVSEGFDDIFTLNFDAGNLSGAAAPNRYAAPYSLAASQAIKVNDVNVTQTTPIYQPEKLRESDFFAYMQNVYQWKLANGNLELLTKGADGAETSLVFAQEAKKK